MNAETVRFLAAAALFSVSLCGAAALLTGCTSAAKIAAYCAKDFARCD